METKTFKAWNGDRQLTRDEYIDEWKAQTDSMWQLFAMYGSFTELQAFIDTVKENAGKAWDKSE